MSPSATDSDDNVLKLLDVLAKDVDVRNVFSNWLTIVTYHANCMSLK